MLTDINQYKGYKAILTDVFIVWMYIGKYQLIPADISNGTFFNYGKS